MLKKKEHKTDDGFIISSSNMTLEQKQNQRKQKKRDKMTEAELMKGKPNEEGGVVVRSVPKNGGNVELAYNNGQVHHIILGSTGSGKTTKFVTPSILSIGNTDGSMIINDPKGELYSLTAEYLRKMGYKIYVFDYFKPQAGSCFNQLFLVQKEYEKGLPHYYAVKAIDSILKTIDILVSGGEDNRLAIYMEETFNQSPGNLPPDIMADLVKGRYTSNMQTGQRAETKILRPKKCPELNGEVISKFNASAEDTIDFLREMYSNMYDRVNKDYKQEKQGTIYDSKYHNDMLLHKQEACIQAAIDTLSTINKDNIKKYYEGKIVQNEAVCNSCEKETLSYKQSSEFIEQYKEILKDLEENGLSMLNIRAFLSDIQTDHDLAWREFETAAIDGAGAIATILVSNEGGGGGDKFWIDTAKTLLKGMILFVCRESYLPFSTHMGSVNTAFIKLSDKIGKEQDGIDLISSRLSPEDRIKPYFHDYEESADKTKQSILVSTTNATNIFNNEAIVDQAAHHEFDPLQLAKEKTAVFLISPGSDDTGSSQYCVLSTLFIEEVYSCLNSYLSEGDLTLPRPVYFILDEIANIPPVISLGEKASLARSKNIRLSLVIQDYQQLEKKYKDAFSTIRGNSTTLYLLSNDIKTAEDIERRLGKKTIQISNTSSSKGGDHTSSTTSSMGRSLLTAQEILQMPKDRALYMMPGVNPYLTKLEPVYKWPIYTWLKKNSIRNIHVKRNPQLVNKFRPDPIDFTFAYESLDKGIILDEYVYRFFKEITEDYGPAVKKDDNAVLTEDEVLGEFDDLDLSGLSYDE